MRLSCPHCQTNVELADGVPAGQQMTCSSCKQPFTVPAKQSAPEATPPIAPAAAALSQATPAPVASQPTEQQPSPGLPVRPEGMLPVQQQPATMPARPAGMLPPPTPEQPATMPVKPAGMLPVTTPEQPLASMPVRPQGMLPVHAQQPTSMPTRPEGMLPVPPAQKPGPKDEARRPSQEPSPGDPARSGVGTAAMSFAGGALSGLGSAAAGLPVLGQLTSAIQPLVSAFSKLGGVVSSILGKKGGGEGQKPEGQKAEGGPPRGSTSSTGGDGGGDGGGRSKFAMVGEAVGSLAGVVTGMVSTFNKLTSAVTPFVQALNPSSVRMLELAQRDATAVIGQGFVPWIRQATASTRFFADSFMGPMKQLAGPIQAVSQAFGGVMNSLSTLGSQVLSGLMPTFKVLGQGVQVVGTVFQGLASGVGAVASVVSPLVNAFSGVAGAVLVPLQGLGSIFKDTMSVVGALAGGLGGLMSSVFKTIGGLFSGLGGPLMTAGGAIRSFTQWLLRGVVGIAGLVAKLTGATSFLQGMRDALAPQKGDSRGMAALQQGTVTDSKGFMNSLLASAFIATPTGPQEEEQTDTDFLKGIFDTLKSIDEKDLGDIITAAIKNAASSAASGAAGAIGSAASGAADFVAGGFGWGREATLIRDP